MMEIANKKTGLEAQVRKPFYGILRDIQAADTPARTGDESRRRAEKLSDENNRANKNWLISEGPEKNS